MHIDVDHDYGVSLLLSRVLDEWQIILADLAPTWSKGLLCWRAYAKKTPLDVHEAGAVRRFFTTEMEEERRRWAVPKRLPKGTVCLPAPEFQGGSAEFRGANKDLCWVVCFCERVFLHRDQELAFGNWVTLQVLRNRIEGQDANKWARDFSLRVCEETQPWFASVRASEEYYAKNMMTPEGYGGAIGLDLYRYLPGIYCRTFFGKPFADFIGRERLLSAPAYATQAIGDGVLVELHERTEAWNTAEYRETERRVLDHIGRQYFFDRNNPDRPTVAPKFDVDTKPLDVEEFLKGITVVE